MKGAALGTARRWVRGALTGLALSACGQQDTTFIALPPHEPPAPLLADAPPAALPLAAAPDSDRDGDGLSEALEAQAGTDPQNPDSDGDGLGDGFEFLLAPSVVSPLSSDSDGNGVDDPAEDPDADGLSLADEAALGSDPLDADSDADGLSDGRERELSTDLLGADTDRDRLPDAAELRNGTDPLRPDSDGDGIGDVDELATALVQDGATGVGLRITGTGDLAGNVTVFPLAGHALLDGAPGQAGPAFDVQIGDAAQAGFQHAELTLPYLSERVADADPESVLGVFYFDPTLHSWAPAGEQLGVDTTLHTVTVTVQHFSIFAVFDVRNWNTTWAAKTSEGARCAEAGDGGGVSSGFVDIALVLDSSGSMLDNDPESRRQASAKAFVEALLPEDRATLVDFDDVARVVLPLTGDKAALSLAIDSIDSSGGTNIGAGVRAGLDALQADTDPARVRALLLLTDGNGNYDPALTARASAAQIAIYAIGLGTAIDEALLRSIATGSGGAFHLVTSADDLPEVFRRIGDATGGGRTTDTDGDGLSDCEELAGFVDAVHGERFGSDPQLPDSDGDGLDDGLEIGERLPAPLVNDAGNAAANTDGYVYDVFSDPYVIDTDSDGLDDAEEVDKGGLGHVPDSDGDGLGDLEESLLGTSLSERDTDHDGFQDPFEQARLDTGYDPLVFTEVVPKLRYLRDFLLGASCGDFCRHDSLAWLAGNLVSGLLPPAAVRDALGSLAHGELIAAGLNLVGVIPGVAVATVTAKLLRFVQRAPPRLALAAVGLAAALLPDDAVAGKAQLFEKIYGAAIQRLERAGLTPVDLARLRGRVDLAVLADARVVLEPIRNGWAKHWRDSESLLRSQLGVPKGQGFPTVTGQRGTTGYRFLDAYDAMLRAGYEVKTGLTPLSDFIREQIAKEARLLERKTLQTMEWHFFPSDISGTLGPTKELLEELLKQGRKVVIHLP